MATMTITTTAGEANRVAVAMGKHLGLGRDATAPEIKAATIDWLKSIVLREERRAAVLVVEEATAAAQQSDPFGPT